MRSNPPLILVADDESHIVHVVKLKLTNAGYRVVTASDGEEALDAALQHRPDLLVTDYQMPLMSGLELCQELFATPEMKELPVLMLTARGFSIEPEELAITGIREVLSKPFSPREVLAKVQAIVGEVEPAAVAA